MVSRPENSKVRQRRGEVASRGKVAAPMAAATHGTAVSRPTWKGDSAAYVPMMPGKKKITV